MTKMRGASASARSLTGVHPVIRALLWVLLLVLAATILVYPVRLTCEYRSIQAPYIFDNPALFTALFTFWLAVLLVLATSKPSEPDEMDWEKLALACVFGVVFWGFWVVITPNGSYADDIYNQAHVKWLVQTGTIPAGHQNLEYFDFPGMHLYSCAVSEVCGLGIGASRTLVLLADSILLCALLYMLSHRILKSHLLALLSVMLIVTGDIVLTDKMHIFTPGGFAFPLLVGLLVSLTGSHTGLFGTALPGRLVVLVIFTAMVISYFPSSLLLPLILLGVFVVQAMARDKVREPTLATISLFAVLAIAWAVYWTWHMFHLRAEFMSKITDQILSGGVLEAALSLRMSNTGGSLPLWATAARFASWIIIGLGTVLALLGLLRVKRLSQSEKMIAGALLGIILFTFISIVGTEGGYQFSRFLLYAPLFAVPAALLYATRRDRHRKVALVLVMVVVFVVSLPSFLSSVNTVSTDAIYQTDMAAGSLLGSRCAEKGATTIVFCIQWDSAALVLPYIPDSTIKRVRENVLYAHNKDEVWDEVARVVADFADPDIGPSQQKLFIMNDKSKVPYQHLVGIPPDDPGWYEMEASLANSSRVYSSGYLEMYTPK